MNYQIGSRVNAITTAPDAAAGEALSLLYVDEAALIENLDELWARIMPTLTTGGRCCISSTPNGTGNLFHKLWKNARDGQGSFNCRFGTYINPEDPSEICDDRFMYWLKPGCNRAWLEQETINDSPRVVAQERLCDFLSSGETFVDAETINRMEMIAKTHAPIAKEYFDRNLWIWENPIANAIYLICCDVSRGDAKDYSAFHVLRVDTPIVQQVAEYRGKIKPEILGELLVEVSKNYNNAIIAVENNSGWSGPAILRIQQLNHNHCLYYTPKRKPKIKDQYGRMVDPYYAEMSNEFLPGFTVHAMNRLPLLAKMEVYLRKQLISINSERFVDELKTFIVTEGGKPEASRGDNDDLILALAGGIMVREESFMHVVNGYSDVECMLSGMSFSNHTTKDVDRMNYGRPSLYDRGKVIEHNERQNKIKIANGDSIDLSWLLGGSVSRK